MPKIILIASNRPFPNSSISNNEELEIAALGCKKTIFFPFWSWKVSKIITDNHECIGFHIGSTPGGSPIQHLIISGYENAFIKAFIMNDKIDMGKTIWECEVSLLGSLEEITIRMTEKMEGFIHEFKKNNR